MLEIKNISKSYHVGTFNQQALKKVSLAFRETEFVSVLGPSGCGKTTLLNMIGGLDHFDEGDLIINGKSTKDFTDREWDMYRNNSIGFIFQSHNLIPHLSVLQNVEMGMSLSGMSAAEAKERAMEVLDQVGLADHVNKRPTQLSGGQSQRVAVARAIANYPDVILADEPTGSLDTETGKQIMDLIKEIAKDKLVIMVTHDGEMAREYASRIIKLKDGETIDDSNPYAFDTDEKSGFSLKKTAMDFRTAVVSSINNIKTKLGRTVLTAFAGSIGIIGIALILSLSNGLSEEIDYFEQETMAGFPISVTGSRFDFEKLREMSEEDIPEYPDTDYATAFDQDRFKALLEPNIITDDYVNYVDDYVENIAPENVAGVKYGRKMNVSLLKEQDFNGSSAYVPVHSESIDEEEDQNSGTVMGFSQSFFTLLPDGDVMDNNYDVIYGEFPDQKNEVVLVVDSYNRIYESTLQRLGYDPESQDRFYFSEIVNNIEFKLFMGEYSVGVSDVSEAVDITISGIVRPREDTEVSVFSNGLGYTSALMDDLYENYPDDVGEVSSIHIYPTNFDAKQDIREYLDEYNEGLSDEERIEYIDQAATFTAMVGGIIDTISIVLIAFAAISLVVSSIMIAIITYISVIERTKEIGVLRALGARKKDISRVFNTENLIIGFVAGLVGISIARLLIIPANMIIENLSDMANVAKLSWYHSGLLIVISIVLAFVAGLIPARMAANKDPVEALRTE